MFPNYHILQLAPCLVSVKEPLHTFQAGVGTELSCEDQSFSSFSQTVGVCHDRS